MNLASEGRAPLVAGSGTGALGAALSLWRDPIELYTRMAREQGDVAHLRIGWRDLYLLNNPDLVHELLVAREGEFAKGYSLTRTKLLLGDGLLTSEGEFHARQRRLIQPAFHQRRISGYAETMSRFAAETGDSWSDGDERDIVKDLMRLSQRIVASCLFHIDIEDEDARQASQALDSVILGFRQLMLPLPRLLIYLPFPSTLGIRRARRTLDELVYRMIADRRRSGDRGDVLSMLLFATDEEGMGMSDRQVRDEAMTIFLAGHDTMGNALSWTFYLLSQHPDVERRWHEELDAILEGRLPEAADFPRLTYTRQLLTESMRLFPPVWAMGRQARAPVEFAGREIAKGSILQVCQWLLHRDRRFFPEPESFQPARWTPEFQKNLPRGVYIPFGFGPRICIGMQFAWMAGVLTLATLGRDWSLQLRPGHPVATRPTITLRPRYGLLMTLERRTNR